MPFFGNLDDSDLELPGQADDGGGRQQRDRHPAGAEHLVGVQDFR